MTSFRTHPTPRNYLSRFYQRRLLVLVFTLGAVLLAMVEARKPENWQWFSSLAIEPHETIGQDTTDDKIVSQTNTIASDGPSDAYFPGTFFPGVEQQHLKQIEDNKVFRPSGRRAWLNLLEVLSTHDAAALDAASTGPVTYAQLLRQPNQYRGQLVTLEGLVLRCLNVTAIPNELGPDREGIDQYYQLILRAKDGPPQAISLYCIELPDGFPTGGKLREPVRATAFFFKNRAFTDGEGVYITPTLLARTVQFMPNDSSHGQADLGPTSLSTGMVLLIAGLAAIFAGCFVYVVHRKGSASSRAKAADKVGHAALLLAALIASSPDVAFGQGAFGQGAKIDNTTDTSQRPASAGLEILKDLGVDVRLWDHVSDRTRLGSQDRELFYQLLHAAGQLTPADLQTRARHGLQQRRKAWQSEEKQSTTDPQRLASLRRMVAAAEKGRFSVIPLFNEPENYHGELIVLAGTALRAIRIAVTDPLDQPADQDIVRRFGFDHYYEIEIVTGDSQNNPLVFCVRRLPQTFPTGDRIAEPVRLAGFFFKSWVYRSRRISHERDGSDEPAHRLRQVAPILIGAQPVWIKSSQPARSTRTGIVAGGLFAAALLGIWFAIWRSTRVDRRFRRQSMDNHHPWPDDSTINELVGDELVGNMLDENDSRPPPLPPTP